MFTNIYSFGHSLPGRRLHRDNRGTVWKSRIQANK